MKKTQKQHSKQSFFNTIIITYKYTFVFMWSFYCNAPMLIKEIFDSFDWNVDENTQDVLVEGVEKHIRCLYVARWFSFFQILLVIYAPELSLLLTIMSFFYLQNGTSWFGISFQNISQIQLNKGVATDITERMYRIYIMALCIMIIGTIGTIARVSFFIAEYGPIKSLPAALIPSLLPEYLLSMQSTWAPINIIIGLILFFGNIPWIIMIFADSHRGSCMYDGMDSMLGNALPEILDGARASKESKAILEKIAGQQKK